MANLDSYYRTRLGIFDLPQMEQEKINRARLMTCALAKDAEDADMLLDALGLKAANDD